MTKADEERRLTSNGWKFIKRCKCKFCKNGMEWWKTNNGKIIPLTEANLDPHWWICRLAFRNDKPGTGGATLSKPAPGALYGRRRH